MVLQNNPDLANRIDFPDLLNCLHDYIQKHGALGRPFDVLRGLTDLTIRRVERAEDLKISSTALQAEVDSAGIGDKSPGSALATPWKTLTERIMVDREQGLQQFFSQHGFDHYLWPLKDKSPGGAGNPSMYYLEVREIPIKENIGTTQTTTDTALIRYIPELTPKPAWWLKRLLEGGYALQGWRRWLLLGFSAISIVIAAAVVLLTLFLLTYAKNLTFQTVIPFILIAITVSWFVYSLISPLAKLLDWRMIKAPDILVSLREDNVLIEMARDCHAPEGSPNIIRLVRYASTCPICSGKVEVVEGKKEFPNRFVGRCRESPAEHVYSFDRVMLHGKLLR